MFNVLLALFYLNLKENFTSKDHNFLNCKEPNVVTCNRIQLYKGRFDKFLIYYVKNEIYSVETPQEKVFSSFLSSFFEDHYTY